MDVVVRRDVCEPMWRRDMMEGPPIGGSWTTIGNAMGMAEVEKKD